MANKYLKYSQQVKKIKDKNISCKCDNSNKWCEFEEQLCYHLSTKNYTRIFTPFKHIFVDLDYYEIEKKITKTIKTLKNSKEFIDSKDLKNCYNIFHNNYRYWFKEKNSKEHKYFTSGKWHTVDFINKVIRDDEVIQSIIWNKVKKIELLLKTNLSHFISKEIERNSYEQKKWLDFLLQKGYLKCDKKEEYIKYIKNIKQPFWFAVNQTSLKINLTVVQTIIRQFQNPKKRNKETLENLLDLLKNFTKINIFKEIYHIFKSKKDLKDPVITKLNNFIDLLGKIRNNIAHANTMQQWLYETRVELIVKELKNFINKQNIKKNNYWHLVKIKIIKYKDIQSMIEIKNKTAMLYTFCTEIQFGRWQPIKIEDQIKYFIQNIQQF